MRERLRSPAIARRALSRSCPGTKDARGQEAGVQFVPAVRMFLEAEPSKRGGGSRRAPDRPPT
eukprot:998972-Rhodomonas_salina.1